MKRQIAIDNLLSVLHVRTRYRRRALISDILGDEAINVLDVGGAGDPKTRWSAFGPRLHRTIVEPDGRNSQARRRDGVGIIDEGLAGHPGLREFHLTRSETNSSLLRPNESLISRFPNAARFDVVGDRLIRVNTLDNVVARQAHPPDLIKLDTQGSELEILGSGDGALLSVVAVEIEVAFRPIYQSQPLFGEVCTHLTSRGFQFVDFVADFRWSHDSHACGEQLLFSDALFLRDFADMGLSSKQRRLLAGVALGYERLDYCDQTLTRMIQLGEVPEIWGESVRRRLRRQIAARRRLDLAVRCVNRLLNESARREPSNPRVEVRW